MPTGYVEHYGIKFTRREIGAIEKKQQGQKLDHFDKQALERVHDKIKKNGYWGICFTDNEFGYVKAKKTWVLVKNEKK